MSQLKTSFSYPCDCGRVGIMNLGKNRFVCLKSMCTKQYSMVNKYNLMQTRKEWEKSKNKPVSQKQNVVHVQSITLDAQREKSQKEDCTYEYSVPEFQPPVPYVGESQSTQSNQETVIPDELPFGYRYVYRLEWEKQKRYIIDMYLQYCIDE